MRSPRGSDSLKVSSFSKISSLSPHLFSLSHERAEEAVIIIGGADVGAGGFVFVREEVEQAAVLRAGDGRSVCGDGVRRGRDCAEEAVYAELLKACGIGGGVVIKPLLDAIGIMPVSTVSFLSGLTVLAMACINVFKNRKGGELEPRRSIPLGIGAAVGGVVGKQLFEIVKKTTAADALVGAVQAAVLGILVLGTLLYVINRNRIKARNLQHPVAGGLIGLALGICSSFLGIGGGPMNLAVLYYFFSMDTKKAAVNSILVILLSQVASLAMTLISGSVPAFQPLTLAAMVAAGAAGGFISARLHRQLSARTTDFLFRALLVVILLICVYNMRAFWQPFS